MSFLDFIDSNTKGESQAAGTDGRSDVSARADSRGYYNSRDKSESFSVVFDDAGATADDYVLYLKNDKTDKQHLVVRSSGVNCIAAGALFTLSKVTGTPSAGGGSVTPFLLNQAGEENSASVTCKAPANSNSSDMTGLTDDGVIDKVGVAAAYGHSEFRLEDQLRLGPGQACAIKLTAAAGTNVRSWGVLYFFFEKGKA